MQEEYLKRLSRYANVEIIEVKDEKIFENATEAENEIVKNKEFSNIFSRLDSNEYIVLLDLHGKEYDSIEFSQKIKFYMDNSIQKLTFIIGGSLGFSQNIYKIAKEKIKLSNLTLTHQMSRVILLEQIYRSFKILNNEQYHK